MKKYFLLFGIILNSIFIDLLTKFWAKKYLINWDFELIFWAKFFLIFNEWIAFSIPIKWILQIILSFWLLIILFFYTKKEWDLSKKIPQISLWLVVWWALWNLYERIFIWKVTDFISISPYFATFNLADSFIFIWACLAFYYEMKKNN